MPLFNLPASLLQSLHPFKQNYSHSSHLAPAQPRSQAANQNESPSDASSLCQNVSADALHHHVPPSTAQQKTKFTNIYPYISWGDPHSSPSTSHLCIVFQNCNTSSKDHFTRFSYLKKVKLLEPHIIGKADTNVNWSHSHTNSSAYSSLKAHWPQLRVATTHLDGAFPSYPSTQAGGCLQLTSYCTSGKVQGSFSDPMGRWCSHTLQKASNHQITIITSYRVCQTARSGLLTAYEQQRRYLIIQTDALHPDPRQAMLKDLQSYIQSLQGPTHNILLMWDANSTLQDPDVQTFMGACQLHNLQSKCTLALPINTSARGRRIDFLFGTTLLQISLCKSGILNFNNSPQSDYRALFADFDEQTLFQGSTTDPTAPSQRLLRLNNPSQCKTYLKLEHAYFTVHKITERSNLLDTLQADTPVSIIIFPLRLH